MRCKIHSQQQQGGKLIPGQSRSLCSPFHRRKESRSFLSPQHHDYGTAFAIHVLRPHHPSSRLTRNQTSDQLSRQKELLLHSHRRLRRRERKRREKREQRRCTSGNKKQESDAGVRRSVCERTASDKLVVHVSHLPPIRPSHAPVNASHELHHHALTAARLVLSDSSDFLSLSRGTGVGACVARDCIRTQREISPIRRSAINTREAHLITHTYSPSPPSRLLFALFA